MAPPSLNDDTKREELVAELPRRLAYEQSNHLLKAERCRNSTAMENSLVEVKAKTKLRRVQETVNDEKIPVRPQ